MKHRSNNSFVLSITLFYILLLISLIAYFINSIYIYKEKEELALLLNQQKQIENYITVDIYERWANELLNDTSYMIADASIIYHIREVENEIDITISIHTSKYSYELVIVFDKIENKIIKYDYGG